MTKKNPFTSLLFTQIWSKHFCNGKLPINFNFFDLSFYKTKTLPIYINAGKNLTKGICYSFINQNDLIESKNKVFLIYDVPKYFKTDKTKLPKGIKLITVSQYPGFITQLNNYKNFEDYINKTFSKKSRYKFKSYKRKLDESFNISYVNYDSQIDKITFNKLFDVFHSLLSKRFEEKSQSNNNLNPKEWEFYRELVFPMMQNKQASLYAILDKEKPIAISLNYFSKDILFFAMTSFDIDYEKYNVGTVHLMELFKWCFEKNIKIFDFSKGYYDYKERWGDQKYDFENHIIYNSSSILSSILAHMVFCYFKLKQLLRGIGINKMLGKIHYFLKRN